MTINIGPFVVGEIPAALEYQFQDANGAAINLTGYTAKFQWGRKDNSVMFADGVTENATIASDPATGKVTYSWDGDEFKLPGKYVGMFWVGNGGTSKFASILITWTVCLSVDTPPAI